MNSHQIITVFVLAAAVFHSAQSHAAIIGTNVPAEPLTLARIEMLPSGQQAAWKLYLETSAQQRRADQQLLQKEMGERGLATSVIPPASRGVGSMPLNRRADWYETKDARRIADIIVSFQTPAGGWSKNIDLSDHPRAAGEGFASDNSSRYVGSADNDALKDVRWSYVATIDNGATTAELRYLAKVISALPEDQGTRYRDAFSRGIDYLLAAQNPSGGWPQVWPLQGGYHDAITYNDGAMVNVMELLREVAATKEPFAFTPQAVRERVEASVERGIECLLATQVVVEGKRTAWCQQHDALTLKPTAARNYEMPSLCSAESAGIIDFLMELPKPDSNVVAAVRSAVAWLEKTQLNDVAFRNVGDKGRLLVPAPGSGPLWARYYEIGSNRPIFGERDKTIHDRVDDISFERRKGYAWFTDGPAGVMKRFPKWNAARAAR